MRPIVALLSFNLHNLLLGLVLVRCSWVGTASLAGCYAFAWAVGYGKEVVDILVPDSQVEQVQESKL